MRFSDIDYTCLVCGAGTVCTTQNGRLVFTEKPCVCEAKAEDAGEAPALTRKCRCGSPMHSNAKHCVSCSNRMKREGRVGERSKRVVRPVTRRCEDCGCLVEKHNAKRCPECARLKRLSRSAQQRREISLRYAA